MWAASFPRPVSLIERRKQAEHQKHNFLLPDWGHNEASCFSLLPPQFPSHNGLSLKLWAPIDPYLLKLHLSGALTKQQDKWQTSVFKYVGICGLQKWRLRKILSSSIRHHFFTQFHSAYYENLPGIYFHPRRLFQIFLHIVLLWGPRQIYSWNYFLLTTYVYLVMQSLIHQQFID